MIPSELAAHNMGLKSQPHTSEYSSNIIVKKIPCLGRLHFVKDKNGIMSLSFTCLYWIYGTWCTLYVILLPRLRDGQTSEFFVYLFCVTSLMCIIALFRAATLNPGRVPLVTDESNVGFDASGWELCQKCMRKRPPKAHHCRRCQQCVLRMDHHCPWINNCVGEENHWAFMQLLFWAFCLGFLAFLSCMLHFWHFPKCVTCDKEVFYIKHGLLFTYLLNVLGLFMMFFMGANLMGQHYNITTDRTTLDNMKDPRPDISTITIRSELVAYREICGGGWVLFWLFPCRTRKPIHSSYYYSNPV